MKRVAALTSMVFVFFFTADLMAASNSQADRLIQLSAKGLFKVEMQVQGQDLKVGKNRLDLFIRDSLGTRTSGARVTVIPFIHQQQEPARTKHRANEKKAGHYKTDHFDIENPGHWGLRIIIQKDRQTDTVSFDFPDVKRGTSKTARLKLWALIPWIIPR